MPVQLKQSWAENLTGEEAIPTSRVPWAALCPPSFFQVGGKIEASTRCCRELSTCYAAAVSRMLFSHRYTMPTPSVEDAGNVSRSAAVAATFWLALVKEGSCHSAHSIAMARPASNIDLRQCRSVSLASTTAHSLANSPLCRATSHAMSSCGTRRHSSWRVVYCSGRGIGEVVCCGPICMSIWSKTSGSLVVVV
jgi:hypothetical protein